MIFSSRPARRRCPLRTICGSNWPFRSRGPWIATAPLAVSTVLGEPPLREFPTPPGGACPAGYPSCSDSSSPSARSINRRVRSPSTPSGPRISASPRLPAISPSITRSVTASGSCPCSPPSCSSNPSANAKRCCSSKPVSARRSLTSAIAVSSCSSLRSRALLLGPGGGAAGSPEGSPSAPYRPRPARSQSIFLSLVEGMVVSFDHALHRPCDAPLSRPGAAHNSRPESWSTTTVRKR